MSGVLVTAALGIGRDVRLEVVGPNYRNALGDLVMANGLLYCSCGRRCSFWGSSTGSCGKA